MHRFFKEHALVICFLNIIFSYAIYYGITELLWKLVIYYDIRSNEMNATAEQSDWLLTIHFIMISFVYFINFGQSIFLSNYYSRHFGGITIIIHQFIFIWLSIMLSTVLTGGCKKREWLCGERSTFNNTIATASNASNATLIDNTSIDKAADLSTYGIVGMFMLEILLVTGSYIKNRNSERSIYYFYPDCVREISSMILFHYLAAIIYLLLPLIILIICMLGEGANGEFNNIGTPGYIGGVERNSQRQEQSERDIENGERAAQPHDI